MCQSSLYSLRSFRGTAIRRVTPWHGVRFTLARFRANTIYALVLLTVLYLLWEHFFDKAEATERCLEGVITRVDKNYTDTSRSGGGRNLEYYAHITVENGTEIVKQVKSNRISQKIFCLKKVC